MKNWLAIFALGVLLVPLREFGGLNGEAHRLGMTVGQLLDSDASFKTWVTLVLFVEMTMVVTIFGLMLSKSPHFRMVTSVIWVSVLPVLALFAFLTDAPGSGAAIGLSFFPWVISCLVWVTYLQRSRRVRVTFEHCVLATDLAAGASAVPAPSPVHRPAATAQRIPEATPSLPAASTSESRDKSAKSTHTSLAPAVGQHAEAGAAFVNDEALWAQALDEFNGAGRKQGLWARAFALASGNESAAQAQYLSERVQQLSDERAAGLRAEAERLAELQRFEELAGQEVARRASSVRADFVSGKRLTPDDVSLLVRAVDVDPSLLALTDRFRGETLLHWSARHGLRAEATTLIGKGANASAPNGDGRRPYELAEDLQLKGVLRSAANGQSSAADKPSQ